MTTTTKPAVRQRTRALDVTPNEGSTEGSLLVTRTRYGSEPQEVTNQKIHVPLFPVPPAYVSVRAKETINMGDYNNVGVEVSISLPCLPEASEIERVYALCSDTVEAWMEREVARNTNPDWQKPQ